MAMGVEKMIFFMIFIYANWVFTFSIQLFHTLLLNRKRREVLTSNASKYLIKCLETNIFKGLYDYMNFCLTYFLLILFAVICKKTQPTWLSLRDGPCPLKAPFLWTTYFGFGGKLSSWLIEGCNTPLLALTLLGRKDLSRMGRWEGGDGKESFRNKLYR